MIPEIKLELERKLEDLYDTLGNHETTSSFDFLTAIATIDGMELVLRKLGYEVKVNSSHVVRIVKEDSHE